jgi:hypothetical protein
MTREDHGIDFERYRQEARALRDAAIRDAALELWNGAARLARYGYCMLRGCQWSGTRTASSMPGHGGVVTITNRSGSSPMVRNWK